MDAGETLPVTIDRGVALLTLNRPEALNALTPEMQRGYGRKLLELGRDRAVRVIVVTGAGRGFCSGADVASITHEEGDDSEHEFTTMTLEQLPTIALDVPKPVVAAINGVAAGIGVALAAACDVRFIAPGARLITLFSRLGLVAENGTSWTLARAVGTARAMEILLSGRAVTAEEAVAIGLATELVSGKPVLDRALDWAHDVADHCAPRALAQIKAQVYEDLPVPGRAAFERSVKLMAASIETGELQEALRARKEGRNPVFEAIGDTDLPAAPTHRQ
jgi:enoyl-CoA hydratase/carnithine racemase